MGEMIRWQRMGKVHGRRAGQRASFRKRSCFPSDGAFRAAMAELALGVRFVRWGGR